MRPRLAFGLRQNRQRHGLERVTKRNPFCSPELANFVLSKNVVVDGVCNQQRRVEHLCEFCRGVNGPTGSGLHDSSDAGSSTFADSDPSVATKMSLIVALQPNYGVKLMTLVVH